MPTEKLNDNQEKNPVQTEYECVTESNETGYDCNTESNLTEYECTTQPISTVVYECFVESDSTITVSSKPVTSG